MSLIRLSLLLCLCLVPSVAMAQTFDCMAPRFADDLDPYEGRLIVKTGDMHIHAGSTIDLRNTLAYFDDPHPSPINTSQSCYQPAGDTNLCTYNAFDTTCTGSSECCFCGSKNCAAADPVSYVNPVKCCPLHQQSKAHPYVWDRCQANGFDWCSISYHTKFINGSTGSVLPWYEDLALGGSSDFVNDVTGIITEPGTHHEWQLCMEGGAPTSFQKGFAFDPGGTLAGQCTWDTQAKYRDQVLFADMAAAHRRANAGADNSGFVAMIGGEWTQGGCAVPSPAAETGCGGHRAFIASVQEILADPLSPAPFPVEHGGNQPDQRVYNGEPGFSAYVRAHGWASQYAHPGAMSTGPTWLGPQGADFGTDATLGMGYGVKLTAAGHYIDPVESANLQKSHHFYNLLNDYHFAPMADHDTHSLAGGFGALEGCSASESTAEQPGTRAGTQAWVDPELWITHPERALQLAIKSNRVFAVRMAITNGDPATVIGLEAKFYAWADQPGGVVPDPAVVEPAAVVGGFLDNTTTIELLGVISGLPDTFTCAGYNLDFTRGKPLTTHTRVGATVSQIGTGPGTITCEAKISLTTSDPQEWFVFEAKLSGWGYYALSSAIRLNDSPARFAVTPEITPSITQ